MNTFNAARDTIAGKLAAAGVPITLDPAGLPPVVLVDLPTLTAAAGVGGWAGEIPVKLIAAPPGDINAATWLTDQLETVLRTLGFARAVPSTVTVGGRDCPAYLLTYPADFPNPDC